MSMVMKGKPFVVHAGNIKQIFDSIAKKMPKEPAPFVLLPMKKCRKCWVLKWHWLFYERTLRNGKKKLSRYCRSCTILAARKK